ncbi:MULTISPECIES: hypothetical protein [unclassified Limnohabitans]|jgi:hypothetical protein|uniref:hypothetical protein n=1 Tax=unclassified Limnohabitans TaxID=2626134 RepID=UPI000CF27FB7|nr:MULTISPECIES: hypothetical protein [unclassified Limnohabitans]PQA79675.1 hypothetical protein C5F52_29150 [Limnohabitans sp. TS-CS-82]BDU56037.1 hypothetical protein LTEGF4_17180 [Limnohabitans sp. TEGF004]
MSEMTHTAEAPLRITTRISLKLKRRPGRETIVEDLELTGGNIQGDTVNSGINVPLLQGLARAFYWQRLLDSGEVRSGTEIAKLEGLNPSTVNELLRITLLDPLLVQHILKGQYSQEMSMMWFTRNALPDLWQKQFM